MTLKPILNVGTLNLRYKKINRSLKWLVYMNLFLLGCSFLILLIPKPSNLYVFFIDISNSMTSSMSVGGVQTKIECAKESVTRFIDNLGPEDHFMLATFGPGNCGGQGLNWIQSNPSRCGGNILIEITNDKDMFYNEIAEVIANVPSTHLSEAVYKVFNYLEASLSGYPQISNLKVFIVGDGQDHCKAIEEGNNVVTLPWSFYDRMSVNVIVPRVSFDDPQKAAFNLNTLADDGNGEYIDVENADRFYRHLVRISSQSPRDAIVFHLMIVLVISLVFIVVLRA